MIKRTYPFGHENSEWADLCFLLCKFDVSTEHTMQEFCFCQTVTPGVAVEYFYLMLLS